MIDAEEARRRTQERLARAGVRAPVPVPGPERPAAATETAPPPGPVPAPEKGGAAGPAKAPGKGRGGRRPKDDPNGVSKVGVPRGCACACQGFFDIPVTLPDAVSVTLARALGLESTLSDGQRLLLPHYVGPSFDAAGEAVAAGARMQAVEERMAALERTVARGLGESLRVGEAALLAASFCASADSGLNLAVGDAPAAPSEVDVDRSRAEQVARRMLEHRDSKAGIDAATQGERLFKRRDGRKGART